MKTLTNILLLAIVPFIFSQCSRPQRTTSLQIEDSVRRYLPILQGDKQDIIVKVKNTGNQPLEIMDVLPSCSCTDVKVINKRIPAQRYGFIKMKYDSNKNTGYAGIYTTIIANTKQKYHTLFFEINVVPDANNDLDYEEIYRNNLMANKFHLRENIKGESISKNYMTP